MRRTLWVARGWVKECRQPWLYPKRGPPTTPAGAPAGASEGSGEADGALQLGAMRILAIDTSSPVSAVSLVDGGRVVAEDQIGSESRHAEHLLPRIQIQLGAAGWALSAIDLIAVGLGPGSFTGLRVGLATAKGLALATGIPVRGISSLAVLARAALEHAELALIAIDAGRGELFGGAYRGRAGQPLETILREHLALPEAFAREAAARGLGAASICGSGARRYQTEFAAGLGESLRSCEPLFDLPQGRHVAWEARMGFEREGPSALARLEPVYMRPSDAKLPERPLSLE
jgi:tRNA threonylcarbamoyladenosine biosynthesis protein TsaB